MARVQFGMTCIQLIEEYGKAALRAVFRWDCARVAKIAL
ncbi:hypothetical protein BSFP_068470 [Burkholderia stabilis]|uniref:Uncharacterized protein n=1 Tax=Burkholderia stabilis TaxID=95485 RepID=A0A1Y1BVF4_9BURK|nr:hypothetical protein BSFP_068470 [Burkholderia stabilis]